jgi:hypothetical protein
MAVDICVISVLNAKTCRLWNLGIPDMRPRSLLRALLPLGCAALLTTSSWAATIEPGQGDLTINQGQGFQPINSRVNANVGDAVMVGPGGGATVVYSDGCKVDVQPGAVTTIAPLSPCASGSYADTNPGGFDWAGAAIGGFVLGVAGFGGYEASKNSKITNTPYSSPASP